MFMDLHCDLKQQPGVLSGADMCAHGPQVDIASGMAIEGMCYARVRGEAHEVDMIHRGHS